MNKSNADQPIGVFDSGIGGLTVVRSLRQLLPSEDICYLGDEARYPYGTKSAETIRRYAHEDTEFLLDRGVKMVIVACHSASSAALPFLKKDFNLPVIGVIEPGARTAVATTRNKRIGVIGTAATISAGEYERAILSADSSVRVIAKSTPLFVPLVEEGWLEGSVTDQVIATYLTSLKEDKIDTLLLGCTHYPLLKPALAGFFGTGVKLVDSGDETARVALEILSKMDLLRSENRKGMSRFYLTDLSPNFRTVGERFLGSPIQDVTRVSVKYEA
ncbi:glutamate racemase [candidate division WOR-3 bacterium]|nr:glutamate racemase [candidate division WOR-3 bacterium]